MLIQVTPYYKSNLCSFVPAELAFVVFGLENGVTQMASYLLAPDPPLESIGDKQVRAEALQASQSCLSCP